MMLRILFTALATGMLLLAAGMRFAREDAPRDVREAIDAALERAIESAKQALPWPPQPGPAEQRPLEPATQVAASAPSMAAEAAPPPASKPMPPPAQAVARTPAREVETVVEESISPLWSAPFVESPEPAPQPAPPAERPLAPDPERQVPLVLAAPSQDEWAGLIRRMLAIYERVGAAE